jgi:hypothetical protein
LNASTKRWSVSMVTLPVPVTMNASFATSWGRPWRKASAAPRDYVIGSAIGIRYRHDRRHGGAR